MLAAGLAAAYSLDEGGGATAGDASNTGNTGTISGATWSAAGKFGGALTFNGTSNWVTVADSASLHLTIGMTLEAWVMPTSRTGWQAALTKERGTTALAYGLYTSDNTSRPPAAYINTGGSDLSAVGATNIALNAWTHLAATYDGANLRFYVNGSLVRTRAATGNLATSTGVLRFGGNAMWGEYFGGKLDELRVYNRALSQGEIQTDMNTPIGSPTPDIAAPTVAVTDPANGASVSGTVAISASASDDVAVIGVQFQLDGVNLGVEDAAAPYSVNWNTATAANGGHALTAIARDAAGHVTTSAAVNLSVANADTTAPTVSLTAPANGATVSNSITVSASASDNVGVVGVQFLLDGAPVGTEDATAPYATAWDSRTTANGSHALSARARDAAGNVTTSAVRTVTVSNAVTDPGGVGQWSGVMNWPLIAINMVLLKTGKILIWDGGPDCIGATSATVWDPATQAFTPVPSETAAHVRDIFCSAQSVLADGRVLVVGGHECEDPAFLGAAIANVFDPDTQTWTKLPDMAYRRWYPTSTILPDGRALVTAGSDVGNVTYVPIPEIYNPTTNTFTKLTRANLTVPNYPFMFVLPDGRVLEAGSDEAKVATRVLDVATQTWTTVDSRLLDGGSAVMYLPGKVMKSGSSYYPDSTTHDSEAAAATTYVLDMTAPAPAWQQTSSMAFGRAHHNLTLLADGSVLATGGSNNLGGSDPNAAVRPAELWNPATQAWTTLSGEANPRMYHSTSLLLPDGRVLSAGGGHNYINNANYFNAEIYSPPYLFKGARPTITSSPSALAYNSSFFVGTPDGARIASVALVRNGAVTHQVNMDQRYVPLNFQQTAGGLTVQAPADANLAPPGYYMLFVIDSNGVPSIAPFVRFPAPAEDTQAPSAPAGVTANPSSVGSVTLTWTAATDNVAVTKYNVYRSAVPGFTPTGATRVAQVTGTSFVDTGLAGGTYYYVVTAQDAAGNVSPASAQASATATGDVTPPTVSLTSPAAGATVSGTVSLSAAASDDVGVVGVQFLVDGVAVGAEDTAAPYSVSWNSATAGNGPHTLTARARDAAGNVTTSGAASVNVSNTVVAAGLVGAWGFDDAAGTTATDSSGHALNGILASATWATAGKFGGALSFDGANSWVTVADNTLLDLTTGMTLEAWVKPNALNGWTNVIMKERAGGMAYALYASDDTGKPPAGYVYRGTDVSAVGASALATGAWTHLGTTYDGANLRLYVDGTLVRTKAVTGSLTNTANPLRIGGDAIWGEYFNGLIDEVRVYSRALTQAEIQSDMNTPVNSTAAVAAGVLAAAASQTPLPAPSKPAGPPTPRPAPVKRASRPAVAARTPGPSIFNVSLPIAARTWTTPRLSVLDDGPSDLLRR